MSDVTVLANSESSGYISRASLTRTTDDVLVAVGGEIHPETPVLRNGVLLLAQALDLAGELGAAAVDARLHGAFGQLQPIGDLLVGQLLDVAQHHRGAQRRRQRVERRAQQLHAVALLERGVGRSGRATTGVSSDGSTSRFIVSRSLRTLR